MGSEQLNREIARRKAARSSFGWLDVLGAAAGRGPCPYPNHRGADWRLATGGPPTCGVCHPPVAGLDIVRLA